MVNPPLIIRVNSPDDLSAQLRYHAANAVARALIGSDLVQVAGVPQGITYKAPSIDATGSDVAGQLEVVKTKLIEAERAARVPGLPWPEAERRRALVEGLQTRAVRLHRELCAMPGAGRGRVGVPGLYIVRVPPVQYAGAVEGEQAGCRVPLDTRGLTGELRDRLDAYLAGGSEAMPYRWQRQGRYVAQSNVSAEVRALMADLWAMTEHPTPCTTSSALPSFAQTG
jgi:hypothetical protein